MQLFGTDGIRGKVGEDIINAQLAEKFGMAIVRFCQKRNLPLQIIIGRDTRESGPVLEDAVVSGITGSGGEAILAGIITTPGLAYLVRKLKAGAGIAISASHNSFEYNGLKPFNSRGIKLKDEEEKELEEYILEKTPSEKSKSAAGSGKKTIFTSAKEKYINFLLENFSPNASQCNLKLILDCANGATYEIAPAVFEKTVKNIEMLSGSPDGKNINDNCGSQHTDNLKNKVIEKSADLGLAFDGDGDRVIAVDEKGRELTGDQMIYIIAKMLKAKGELKNNLVVTTVMSNLGFIQDLEKIGIKHITTPVGDRPVFFEMQKSGAILGGEESGHIILAERHPAGDGISAGLTLIEAMNYFGKPLSELAEEITLFPKVLINIEVKSKPELHTIPEIYNIIQEVGNKLGKNGRVLVRYSGTENLCRIMIEGRDEQEITGDANIIAKIISSHLS
jgi:phosphoglucosamine mutase